MHLMTFSGRTPFPKTADNRSLQLAPDPASDRPFRVAAIAVALALYLVALFSPAASFNFFCNDCTVNGLGLLAYGWGDVPAGFLPWISNFLFFASVICLARGCSGWAVGCSCVALMFASRVLFPYSGADLLTAKWWWIASYAVLAAGSAVALLLKLAETELAATKTVRGTGR